jgi:hypothetical protein
MKPKQISLIAIVIVVLIVGLAAWYELYCHQGAGTQSVHAPLKPLSEIKVPEKAVLAQMDRLERKMHLLASPAPRIRQPADLSGIGYVPLTSQGIRDAAGRVAGSPASNYRVTLAFDGQVKRYCVVDGQLHAEGAVLSDGTLIEKIESRRVLITKEGLQQWLVVAPVFDAALSEKSLQGDNG